MQWDSSFLETVNYNLKQLEKQQIPDSTKENVLSKLLSHYQSIDKNNKSRIKLSFEEANLNWLNPLASYMQTPQAAEEKLIKGLPDTYYPAKTLAPNLLTDSALTIAANDYPKEILYNVRFMTEADALFEVELAALSAPYEAKQYLHYSNNVNKLLRSSEKESIKKLFELYEKYRFSSKSFYLLDAIYAGDITMEEADKISKNKELFYNALVAVVLKENSIGKFSAKEKLSELSDRYVRKLMFQRYLSSSMLKMEPFETLSREAKIYFLFNSQNLLKKKDLQNLAKLFKREHFTTVQADSIPWMPLETIAQFKERLQEENLQPTFAPYISYSVWALLNDNFDAPVNIYEPVAANTEATSTNIEATEVAIPEFVFVPYDIYLSYDDKEYIKFKNNPYEYLKDLSKVTNKLNSRKMLINLAENHPVEVMGQLDKFISQPYTGDVLKALAKNAPLTAKNYLINANHKIHYFLQSSQDTAILSLYHIDKTQGNWTRAYILLDKIVNGEISMDEANLICKDKAQLLPHLIDLFKREDYLGAYTVNKELEYVALDFIRNYNISENTDGSFSKELNNLDAATIYTFLVLGEQEIIGTTFYKMYTRLKTLTSNNFTSLLEEMNYKHTDQFIRMAVHYGKESDVFRSLNNEQYIFSKIFSNLEEAENGAIESTSDAASILISLYDRNRLATIQDIIQSEYERCEAERKDNGVATYGILASILAQRLHSGWVSYAAPHFQIPNLISIPVSKLFNEDLINVQQYYFYNDHDGVASYRNFKRQYEKSSYNWSIDDKGSFIKISSKNGKQIEIYANKPAEGEAGIKALNDYLKSNDLQPQVLVHRGLSTHTLKTFNRVPASIQLILDGSCGGFHIQGVALENAPDAQILCNRNIGTMHINDPMFKQISESIRQGEDIVWPNFWSDMEARLGSNPYFKDYIPPHKNVATLVLKAYYEALGIN